MVNLKQKVAEIRAAKKQKQPVWRGPEVDGVTQSLLSRFLVCRERFRLLVVEGLRPADRFEPRLEYGQMWHVCEEALAGYDSSSGKLLSQTVEGALKAYCNKLCQKYRTSQEQVVHWMNVCNVQFPIYLNYWRKHPDVKQRTPLLQEQTFDVPYTLPSGRTVRLRGKWDSVDLIGKTDILLQENKTKGEIVEEQIKKQLAFDLQVMFYQVALIEYLKTPPGLGDYNWKQVKGVRYNVIRRPLSGGAGSIRQHKPSKGNPRGESAEEFYARLGGLIREAPETYFMRWRVEVTPADVERFRRECLDPILEQLCDWWDDQQMAPDDPFGSWRTHYRLPFGIYNVLAEGGSHELDEYLATGSTLGLQRTDNLFPELAPDA